MKNKAWRICLIVLAIYLLLGALFYAIAGESLRSTPGSSPTVSPKKIVFPFSSGGKYIEQTFDCNYDRLDRLDFMVGTQEGKSRDTIVVEIFDEKDENRETPLFRSDEINAFVMKDNEYFSLELGDNAIEHAKNKTFVLRIKWVALSSKTLAFYCGNSVSVGKGEIDADFPPLLLNGKEYTEADGSLCLTVYGSDHHWFGQGYWYFYAGGAVLLCAFLAYLLSCLKQGKKSLTLGLISSLTKYRFLIKQLVSRDFKTKYKRSVLGVLWSFLNPLLTMSIQFVVFSTLFKTDIENFVIYLLIGIICFNFFSETTSMCLMSVIGNASLINKVYVPKYIYPFSRALSSGINLLLSLVPLLLMLLITGTPITPAFLLLPFALLMLFLFSYGIGLILATMMVFFRDTQFLWNIFSMLLMYLTPIFYPETIIPQNFIGLYRMNPLYQFITFARSILIDGVSPSPASYLCCLLFALIPLALGILIFKKNEDKFILNI